MVERAVGGAVARRARRPRRAPVLVGRARDQAVHGRRPGLLHADAAAVAGRITKVNMKISSNLRNLGL